jgi:hypothetical protein
VSWGGGGAVPSWPGLELALEGVASTDLDPLCQIHFYPTEEGMPPNTEPHTLLPLLPKHSAAPTAER